MISVKWIDRGREPQCAPDPAYPDGIKIDHAQGQRPSCTVPLDPYPTPRCGYFEVVCGDCKQTVIITTAGRPDDPRQITLACRIRKLGSQGALS